MLKERNRSYTFIILSIFHQLLVKLGNPHLIQITTITVSVSVKMSIRSNPMKAVPLLLKRVKATRTKLDESFDVKMDMLTRVLTKIEDVFMIVKRNQDLLLDALHEVDGLLRKPDTNRLDQDMPAICQRITDCAHKLLRMDHFDDDQIVESSSHDPSSSKHNNNQLLLPQTEGPTFDQLTFYHKYCLISLSVFPKEAVIKKRVAIYFWIGSGILYSEREKTAEEVGEEVIDELLNLNVIVPYGNAKSPILNKFQIHSRFRPVLDEFLENPYETELYFGRGWTRMATLLLRQRKVTIRLQSHHANVVFNVSSSYLNFESQWLDKQPDLEVLQLGRWQDSPSHHIEVGNQDFLNNLTHPLKLRYLSLRGISRVFELPPSITQLESLEILDLKACHNLETLPDDISSLKNLTHLILSQCYLLDVMPRGIDKLHKLQVLKGFVLGNAGKTPCKISDLAAQLKYLRRLSIHIATEAVIDVGEFESLEKLSKLKHLKISWGVFDKRYSEIQIKLPSSLEKLHVEGFPGKKIPEWLKPSEVAGGLKELNITGGKLESMEHDQDRKQWGMMIVRLKYVKYLDIDIERLQTLFASLKYALIKPIPYKSYTEWSNWEGKPICNWNNWEPFP